MIIFPAVGKPKRTLYVFTDVDCGYCRKLHQEVPALNKAGVEIRYLAFPRSGPDTPASAKMDAVWCAKDRLDMLTQAKRGVPVPILATASNCKAVVDDEYQMGIDLGVDGTPTVLTPDGKQIGGYVPAVKILKILGLN
jgi:thiol:disulfide interchange protein DsbC